MTSNSTDVQQLSEYAESSLHKVAVSEGFEKYKFQVEEGSSVGDGFSGIILKVTIIENDYSRQMNVVVKSPPENALRRQALGTMLLFEREVFIYAELLPEFAKFQRENYLKIGFYEFPKCYLAEFDKEKDEAVIIMEDLRDAGYKLINKNIPVDYEHAKLSFAALGRLHAISIAMKEKNPEIFKRFKVLVDNTKGNLENETIMSFMEGCMDRAIATLKDDEVKRRDKMLKLKENLVPLMKELTDGNVAEPFGVICHGDCWSNNFMYKYHNGKPEKIVILDWQASRYSSPACDLTYFLFACTDQQLRLKHYDEFITIYHHSIQSILDHFRCDIMKLLPFTALMRQLKKFGKYGIFISCFILPMLAMKAEDLPDTDELINTMEDAGSQHFVNAMEKGFEADMYSIRMRGNLEDAFKLGFL